MRSTKKLVTLSLTVLVLATVLFTLAACFLTPDGHQHSYVDEVVAPTCTENGYTKHTCSCGDSYTDNETPAAHKMQQVARKNPTCSEAGVEAHLACSLCGYVDGEKVVIPAEGHTYMTTYQYPTATQAGSKTSICRVCGDKQIVSIDALSATLPNVSEVLANIIGTLSATLEVTEGSYLVYVTELKDYTSETGSKQALFIELAEVSVDGSGETLKAHLKVKIGFAEATLTGLVPAEDVVVDKNNAEYFELSVYVNGEDVSIAVNGENSSVKLSEAVYGALSNMLGVDVEDMLVGAYLSQELSNLLPLIEKALNNAVQGLPTVSPEYSEHLEELFALLGEEIVTVTTDSKTGNKTYSLNLAALTKLVEEVEGKTLAEYLESVFGENVVGELTSFLKALPDKTVKDIVNAAVDLADGTGVAIEDVYMLIDLYVYFTLDMEFSIEEQISDHYNQTLAELLAELNGIDAANQADFINTIKESLNQVAEMLETASVDELLSLMFTGAEEGFLDGIKTAIGMLDEQITLNITLDAEGNMTSMYYALGEMQYSITVNGDEVTMNIVMPGDIVITAVCNSNGINVVVTENDKQVASGNITVTEVVEGDDVISTLEVDLRDDRNDLFDYRIVTVNGVITEADIVVRGYDVAYDSIYDSETDSWIETKEETFVTNVTVEYDDLGDAGKVLSITSNSTVITITEKDGNLTLVVTEDDKQVASGSVTKAEAIEGDDVITTLEAVLEDDQNELLVYRTVSVNGVVTEVYAAVKGYISSYDVVYDPELDEYVEIREETYVTWLEVTYQSLDDGSKVLDVNAHDELHPMTENVDQLTITVVGDQISAVLSKDGEQLTTVNFSTDENGLTFEVIDSEGSNAVLLSLEAIEDGDSVGFDALFEVFGVTYLDGTVTFAPAANALTISIDVDRLLISDDSFSTNYVEFEGAIQFKIAD